MNEDHFHLVPLDPNTDSKINLFAEQRSHESVMLTIN